MAIRMAAVVEKGKGEGNFSCFATENIDKCGINGFGRSAREAMEDMYAAVRTYKAMREEEGLEFPDVEFDFRFDVGSFFDYYPINATAFARYIGMNAVQLRQYISCAKVPKQATLDRIRDGMQRLLKDMGAVPLIEAPVTSYI